MMRHLPSALLAALAVLVAACGIQAPSTPPAAGMAVPEAGPYRIRVGDQLDVRFYQTPELNVTAVPVRSDGRISVELLGDVEAAGSTPDELTARLVQGYSRELEKPRITVIVRVFGGQVYVAGEVGKSGNVPYTDGLTALQAIAASGGFTDNAEPTTVALLRRDGEGRWQGFSLALSDVVDGDDPMQDAVLQPSDIVYVPKSTIANIDLFVKQYIRDLLPVTPALPVF